MYSVGQISNLNTNITHPLWEIFFSISLQPETNWLFSKSHLNCPEGFSKCRQGQITGWQGVFEKFPQFHKWTVCVHHPRMRTTCEAGKGPQSRALCPATTWRIQARISHAQNLQMSRHPSQGPWEGRISLNIILFFFFFLFRATSVAYGRSQARGPITAAVAGLHHSHRITRSKPRLWPTPKLMAMLEP